MSIFPFRGGYHHHISMVLVGVIFCGFGAKAEYPTASAMIMPIKPSQPIHAQFGFADMVASIEPAVVSISTTQASKAGAAVFHANDTFGNASHTLSPPRTEQQLPDYPQSLHTFGSGLIIDPEGYIVTNEHVVGQEVDIQVLLNNGRTLPAHVVGRDAVTDLALLKINTLHRLPFVVLGDSNLNRVGDWVVAIGNSYRLGTSVSAGIISSKNRDLDDSPYDDFLQTDAALNPGDSGGPLLNAIGQVIGINTAIWSPTGSSVGVGFAIPSNIVHAIIQQLREHGHVRRGWIGIRYQLVTPAIAKWAGLPRCEGVLVNLAMHESPAAAAGVHQGDIILSMNRTPISIQSDLAFAVANTPPGHRVSLIVWRDGREYPLYATVGTQDAQKIAALDAEVQSMSTRSKRQILLIDGNRGAAFRC